MIYSLGTFFEQVITPQPLKNDILYNRKVCRMSVMPLLSCDLQCCFTAIHKCSPVASWDTSVQWMHTSESLLK